MTLKLNGELGSVSLDAPSDTSPSGSDITLTLPTTVGSAEQFLKNSGTAGELEYSSMVETSTGVGIANSSPSHALHIHDGTGSGAQVVKIDSGGVGLFSIQSGTSSEARIEFGDSSNDDAGYIYYENDNDVMKFGVNAAERARIDSNGRLLVGLSSGSGDPIAAFQGRGTDASDSGIVAISRTGTNPSGSIGELRFSSGSDLDKYYAYMLVQSDDTTSSTSLPGRIIFGTTASGATSPTEAMRVTNGRSLLIGQTNESFGTRGHIFKENGQAFHICDTDTPLLVNRQDDDGELVRFAQNDATEGNITVSGSTVSYNGGHLSRWSQLAGGAERTAILRGSVLSNLDEMCEWGEEDNEQLNRMKVSDVEGDVNVAGVFQAWDDDDDTYTNDFYCAMTGDFVIRIAQGTTVARGDLLMSAGDGTAKPQDDDIVRSKTIAKVTSTTVSTTYSDGSYCVPCVLMAC